MTPGICFEAGGLAVTCPTETIRTFGDDELGRLAAICYSHVARTLTTTVPAPTIPTFQPGWEACEKVYSAWLESETARQQRKAATLEEQQRQQVIDFASKLPKQ